MQQQDALASLGLKTGLQYMYCKTIDIGDNAGADTGWERGISVGRQASYIYSKVTGMSSHVCSDQRARA